MSIQYYRRETGVVHRLTMNYEIVAQSISWTKQKPQVYSDTSGSYILSRIDFKIA